ncbi:MAG: hypothetical protein sL5_00640 [Candidatus Mesenet longicola]|uniref:Uncharacterized protein n=1 Tax=Candidatus Mesenet longicola TaxID=1892558 RepID=A0A8J3HWU7_9RICK|nr:MAG: hypothetical protein sGL2_00320 [Candidatus Mesenet longicola]GHM59071.1 MAG: hypothetical protein sL5_00640 [Candidatus Mesenet longicola]
MRGELDTIIVEKLGTLDNSNLYRTKIIESLFVHNENVYRRYQHRKCDYGEHKRINSNNLCSTIYTTIKQICDENTLAFPFLLSCFYNQDILGLIKEELINDLISRRYTNLQLNSNIEDYLQSSHNIQAKNDFLYKVYSDCLVTYKAAVSTIIKNRIKHHISELTPEEARSICRSVSYKIEDFDCNRRGKQIINYTVLICSVYTFTSLLLLLGNTKLNRNYSKGEVLAIAFIPSFVLYLASRMLKNLFYIENYNIRDSFKDFNDPSSEFNEVYDDEAHNMEKQTYESFV